MKNKFPFYGVDRFYKKHSEEILEIIQRVFSSGQVLMGPDLNEFEKNIATQCDRKYAVAVGSCTDALFFALKASGIQTNDEVLVTSFSYLASATPILRAGAIPVFVDIDPNTLMMNLDDLEKKITPKSKAIVIVHLFGNMLDVDALLEIATKNDLIVIEDAAQALGSAWKGKKAGSIGLCSCISFDPTKIIGAFGNGGVLLTDDPILSSAVASIRNHGKNAISGEFQDLGYNSKLSTAQAGLLNYQLGLLQDLIEGRATIALCYREHLDGVKEITPLTQGIESASNFHKYVIKVERRDELQTYLMAKGIQTKIHYPYIIPELQMFKKPNSGIVLLPKAQKAKTEVLSLPIYPELTQAEAKEVCKAIRDFFGN